MCGPPASTIQDVPEQRSLEYPKLYEPGQLNLLFNKREFFICIAQGIYTSVVLFFVPYGVLSQAARSDGVPLADYQTFAVTVATSLVIVVSVQVRPTSCFTLWVPCSFLRSWCLRRSSLWLESGGSCSWRSSVLLVFISTLIWHG